MRAFGAFLTPSEMLYPAWQTAFSDLPRFTCAVQSPDVAQGHISEFLAEVERCLLAHWVRKHVGSGQVGHGNSFNLAVCQRIVEHDVPPLKMPALWHRVQALTVN